LEQLSPPFAFPVPAIRLAHAAAAAS
jgi:hypothetical protein